MLDLRAAAAAAAPQSVAAVRESGRSSTSSQRPRSSDAMWPWKKKTQQLTEPGAGHDGVNAGGHEDTRHGDYSQQKVHRGTPTGGDFHRANEKGGDAARRRLFNTTDRLCQLVTS